MKEQIGRSIGFFRATALGGLLFLLPVAVIIGILGYVYSFAAALYDPVKDQLQDVVPIRDATGIALLFAAVVGVLLALCFVAGLFAHRAIGRRFAQLLEKYLTTLFPRYAIYRDLLAGNIGGTQDVPSLKPVTVKMPDGRRIAFESDRLPDGSVMVFFPGAPDPWIGTVGIVEADRVELLDVAFNDIVGLLEQLGRGASEQHGTALTRTA
ncbi:MAG TPA: hypothetical protein DCG12_00400 [Planctomycetaceae bacterium]|nr:hypothetical protein [Planctomycetaceae bacterium]|tara:strand:- start:192 stop:821 length:630 start_codon:yes stop_codon:yes gene_type:complete